MSELNHSGLQLIRQQCERQSDAVRWASILEATAPKAGNVYPGRDFNDLRFGDFVAAAECTAQAFDSDGTRFSQCVLQAAEQIALRIGTNVNLGILLLLGPLVWADRSIVQSKPALTMRPTRIEMQQAVVAQLQALGAEDSRLLYAAINVAAPGGMGKSDHMDLNAPAPADFLAAMQSAAPRDRIASNYAGGFTDLFQVVVPVVADCIEQSSDLLSGIALAQLQLLAQQPDSLIARKYGAQRANEVQVRANMPGDPFHVMQELDEHLRSQSLNPGTTADLIAAALYILLRENKGVSRIASS